MAADGSRPDRSILWEGAVPVAPGLAYLGSTNAGFDPQVLKDRHVPIFEMPPGFFPAHHKHGPPPSAAATTKPGNSKGPSGKAKKGGAKAAAKASEASGPLQSKPAAAPAHHGKTPSNGPPKPAVSESAERSDSGTPASVPFSQPAIQARKLTESEARELERQAAATRIDYSKWAAIVDSDDERSEGGGSGQDEGGASDDEVDEYGWVFDEDVGHNVWSTTGRTIKRSEAIARGQTVCRPGKGGKEKRRNYVMPEFGSVDFFEHMARWSMSAEGKAALAAQAQASDRGPDADEDHEEGANTEGGGKQGQASSRSQTDGTAAAKGRPIDYSKWDAFEDSDDERERAAAQGKGCCRHCKCCYPDGNDSDSECSDDGHDHRHRQVHTVPGRTRDDSPEPRSDAAPKTRGRGMRGVGGRGAGEPPPSRAPRAGLASVGEGSKHEKERAVGIKESESAAKKPGLKGGFFAPKAAAKATEEAPGRSGKEAGDAGSQKPSVDDLRIYHKLGGTAKPLTAFPLKSPEEQENWWMYIHSDGRLYFVRAGSSGLGTWWKPEELLDVTEAPTGWQELYDKTGRVYYYHAASGCSLDTIPDDLAVARFSWPGRNGSGPRMDLMAEAAWHDICKHARGAATREEAAERAIASMRFSRFFPAGLDPASLPGLQDTIRKRMHAEWPACCEEGEQPGLRCPVGKLTDFPPKFPERHHQWLSYKHAEGRFYFVHTDDPGPGTWYRPEDLLDIPEYITGWQQVLGTGPGSMSYYHVDECRSQKALPAVLAKARLLQEHCPFLTPHLAARRFPAFLKHMEQAKTEAHAERLAAEAVAKYLKVPPPSVPSSVPDPRPQSSGSQAHGSERKTADNSSGPSNGSQRKAAADGSKAAPAKQGGTSGPRFSVENFQLTRYRRMQEQVYHDWQAYKHADGRLYFVREGDPGPGTWRKPYDLQDATEGLSGWQDLTDADGRPYYWHDGQQRRSTALPEELRQARDLADRESGNYGPLPDPAEVIDLMLTAKTPEDVTEGIMRGALTAGMTEADKAVMHRLVAAKMAEKWPEVQAAQPNPAPARNRAPGANATPSGAAARSGAADGKSGKAGAQADVSRRKEDANGRRDGAVKGAAGAGTATSSGAKAGTAGTTPSDEDAAAGEDAGEGGYRVGPGGERVKVCWSCGKDETEAGKFKKCDACARARYCSRDCQRDHWRSHKDVCREWAAERLKRKLAANNG